MTNINSCYKEMESIQHNSTKIYINTQNKQIHQMIANSSFGCIAFQFPKPALENLCFMISTRGSTF